MEYYMCNRGASEDGVFDVPSTSSKNGLIHKIKVSGGNVSCTCVGFKTHGYCKHSKSFKSSCGWNQFIDGDKPKKSLTGELVCPKCSGKVVNSGI